MSKKINIKEIAYSYRGIKGQLNSQEFKNWIFEIKKIRTNSSDEFSYINSRLIQHTLLILIIISYSYYILKNNNNKLSKQNKDILKKIQELTIKEVGKYEPNKIETTWINNIFRKKAILDLTKEDYFHSSRKFVQKDSKSKEHKNAFNNDEYDNKNNFVLKIRGAGDEKAYIRIGVIIETTKNKENIIIKNIVNKRNQK